MECGKFVAVAEKLFFHRPALILERAAVFFSSILSMHATREMVVSRADVGGFRIDEKISVPLTIRSNNEPDLIVVMGDESVSSQPAIVWLRRQFPKFILPLIVDEQQEEMSCAKNFGDQRDLIFANLTGALASFIHEFMNINAN
jgi:hypothetical protein